MLVRIVHASWVLAACACVVASSGAQTPFGPKLLSTQSTPHWCAIGDIDADGHADVVCTSAVGAVSVFRGLGSGGFQAPIVISQSPGQSFIDIALADMDLDGDLDVIALSEPGSSVFVWRYQGSGVFLPAASVSEGIYGTGLAIGDLDGNGYPDAVASNAGAANSVRVLLNSGTGTLIAGPVLALGGGVQPVDIALADFDGDGDLDIATANGNNTLAVLSDNGGASFGAPVFHPTPSHNIAVTVGDWDNDGRPDVAVTDQANQLVTLINNGAGGFVASTVPNTNINNRLCLTSADLDGDGRLDLVSTSYGQQLEVRLGLGGGAFAAGVVHHAGGRFGAAIGDLDGDGRLDVAVARDQSDQLGILLGDGNGGFSRERFALGQTVGAFAVADVDNDGRPDLVGADGTAPVLNVRLALPSGGFGPTASYAVGAPSSGLVLAHVDGDPFLDAITLGTAGGLRVLFGDGLGGFTAPTPVVSTNGLTTFAAGDVTGDGLADLVFSYFFLDGSGYSHQGTVLQPGNGLGGFGPVAISSLVSSSSFAFGDFDEDGIDDVLRAQGYEVYLWLANGAGGFTQRVFRGTDFADMKVVDIDEDGHLDVIGAEPVGGVRVLRGDGDGHLGRMRPGLGGSATKLAVGDVDGDGHIDVVAAASGAPRYLEGTGTVSLIDRGGVVEAGQVLRGLDLADVNGDLRPDLLVGVDFPSGVVAIENRGPVNGPVIYCAAKVTSNGCVPAMGASGNPSATATSGFVLTCTQAINNKRGILIYSTAGRADSPFQGGTLCVHAPVRRSPIVLSNGNPPPDDCSGVFTTDFNEYAHGLAGGQPDPALIVPGTRVTAQWWGRDPLSTLPGQSLLSDAIDFVVGP